MVPVFASGPVIVALLLRVKLLLLFKPLLIAPSKEHGAHIGDWALEEGVRCYGDHGWHRCLHRR